MELPSGEELLCELVLDAKATLGEGSIWHPMEKALYWVDIESGILHRYDPETKINIEISLHARVGTVVLHRDRGVIVALQNGIYHINPSTGSRTLIVHPITDQAIRYNDGKCDAAGRLWVGTMHLEIKKGVGVLYRIDITADVQTMLENITISNGIIWSKDNRTMYYTDTNTNLIEAFDFDLDSGAIASRRTVITIPKNLGSPDGITIDEDDKLWVALYGGSAVVQIDPAYGRILQQIRLPVPKITSCAFGGEDLRTLYITSARENMSQDELAEYPLSGALFSLQPGARGVTANFCNIPIG